MSFDLSAIVQIIIAVGVIVAGCGYAYGQFFSGKNKKQQEQSDSDIETLGYLRGQIEGLQNLTNQLKTEAQDRQVTHNAEVTSLHGQMEKLKGQMQEKDKLLDHYTKIFENRDPQLVEILTKVSSSLVGIESFMQKMEKNVSMRKE